MLPKSPAPKPVDEPAADVVAAAFEGDAKALPPKSGLLADAFWPEFWPNTDGVCPNTG